jgi:hypothetical protein
MADVSASSALCTVKQGTPPAPKMIERRSRKGRVASPGLAHHGLASEAALHGFRPHRIVYRLGGSPVQIGVPPEIGGKRLVQHLGRMCCIHRRMMFESVLANLLHQLLQARHFYYRPTAESI